MLVWGAGQLCEGNAMRDKTTFDAVEPLVRVSVTEQVFDALYNRILSLELPPKAKLSEAEVSKQLNVSRQSVRDAFYRLSVLGFLVIRPQRATIVSQISANEVYRARYLRTAIEIENITQACKIMGPGDWNALQLIIDQQEMAIKSGENEEFHTLDNAFHRAICDRSGVPYAWDAIQENKVHTDRVRFLALAFSAQDSLTDHIAILDGLRARDVDAATSAVRTHLSRIEGAIAQLREQNHEWFDDQ